MESEGSLPYSYDPTTGPILEVIWVHFHDLTHYFFKFRIFYVPNLVSIFCWLGRSKKSNPEATFRNILIFFGARSCYPLIQGPICETTFCHLSVNSLFNIFAAILPQPVQWLDYGLKDRGIGVPNPEINRLSWTTHLHLFYYLLLLVGWDWVPRYLFKSLRIY
jgi:hypothetical protein